MVEKIYVVIFFQVSKIQSFFSWDVDIIQGEFVIVFFFFQNFVECGEFVVYGVSFDVSFGRLFKSRGSDDSGSQNFEE